MPNTRSNRFAFPAHTPSSSSLHRLRTAFSPARSSRSISPSSSSITSPLTRTGSPDSRRSAGARSMHSIRDLLLLRHRPSVLEFEMQEEKHLFGSELEMLEPRPSLGAAVEVGIFEVLSGKC